MDKRNAQTPFTINNIPKSQPPDGQYRLKTINKKEHLTNIQSRLINEVGDIVDYLNTRNRKEPHIGFFALVRMITPIIESVASAEGIRPHELLEQLGNPMPYVTWCAYRHGFMHNDEFIAPATENGLMSAPGIFLVDPALKPHLTNLINDGRWANPLLWYRRLLGYLEQAVTRTNSDDEVEIIEFLVFKPGTKGDKEIKESHRRIVAENLEKSVKE